ncbi:hypothetical protein [Alistipes sp.]|uniref:hypothetical protein n=1 Tax=Alistipes sp. TaxID=1872444 RepID=UPI000E7EA0E1|nr:hypothetical protein [Alistipes sp.]HBX89958.1 hypothetical protein [Alistipes sp.]HCN13668.1 hypothetical protein [Alistipes sp.]
MCLHHFALRAEHLEEHRAFYADYFGAARGAKHVNAAKGLASRSLRFGDGCFGCVVGDPDGNRV